MHVNKIQQEFISEFDILSPDEKRTVLCQLMSKRIKGMSPLQAALKISQILNEATEAEWAITCNGRVIAVDRRKE